MFKVTSTNFTSSDLVVQEILNQSEFNKQTPDVCIIFISSQFGIRDIQTILDRIKQKYPQIQILGCTGSHEFSSTDLCTEGGVAAVFIYNSDYKFHLLKIKNINETQESHYSFDLLNKCPLALCFGDITGFNNGESVFKLGKDLFPNTYLFGGVSSGGQGNNETLQWCNNEIVRDGLVILGIEGDVQFQAEVFDPYKDVDGLKVVVNKADDLIVHEINGRSALDWYADYLKIDKSQYTTEELYQLICMTPLRVNDRGNLILRAPLEILGSSIKFASYMKSGTEANVSSATTQDYMPIFNKIIDGAAKTDNSILNFFVFCFGVHSTSGMSQRKWQKNFEVLKNSGMIGLTVNGELCGKGDNIALYNHTLLNLQLKI